MWQYELVRSAGNGRKSSLWNSQDCDLIATFEFAEGVTTKLSLPWSLFEHMVGNWLVSMTNPSWAVRLDELLEMNLPIEDKRAKLELARLKLPTTTEGQLRHVLENGRAALLELEGGEESEKGRKRTRAVALNTA